MLEVDLLPAQGQQFALAHAGSECHREQTLERKALSCREQLVRLLAVQSLHFMPREPWNVHFIAGIVGKQADAYGRLEGIV